MRTREPIFEKSRSVEDLERMRLMALLRELARDKGVKEAAQALAVDHRTLIASLEGRELSRRVRVALKKALLSGAGSAAAEQRERNEALERRVEEMEGRVEAGGKDMSRGLAAVQGEIKALRDEHAQGTRQVERRPAQVEAGGGAQGEAAEAGRRSRGAQRGGPRFGGSIQSLSPLSLRTTTRRCSGTPGRSSSSGGV